MAKSGTHLIRHTKADKHYIYIPGTNVLDENALSYFEECLAADPTSFRRNHLALDYPLMRAVRNAKEAYLQVVEMNHKSLNMRGAWFAFEDENKPEADLTLTRWLPHSDIHAYMAWAFPWLDYEHTNELQDPSGAIEGETHKLRICLNGVGKAFLELEGFYRNGASPKDYEIPYEENDEMDEDEYAAWAFRHAMEKD